jgi:hypothetical protein
MEESRDNKILLAWFTGFYEGEGSVSNDINNRNRIVINISQNDPKPLEIGKRLWGGYIRKRTRKSPASDKICNGNEWVMKHKQALVFLEDIKPFMLIPRKIVQMKTCLDKMNTIWDKRFKCKYCDKDYSDPSGRRRHERNTHTLKNPDASLVDSLNKLLI